MISKQAGGGRGIVSGWLTRARLMTVAGFVLMLAVWNFIVVPSWLRGEWNPSGKLMRFFYQCHGTPEQEAIRWKPHRMLVSACRKPTLIAESDNHQRVLILNRADSQYVVLDRDSGEIVISIAARDYRVNSLVGDRYLYATSVPPERGMPGVDYIVDINTYVFVPMTQVPWEIKDISPLVNEYESSRGNVIQVIGIPQAFLFIHSTNEFTAFNLTTPPPATIQVLIDSWEAPVLNGNIAMRTSKASVAGGDVDCIIGEHKYVGTQNPFGHAGYTFCMFSFPLPVTSLP